MEEELPSLMDTTVLIIDDEEPKLRANEKYIKELEQQGRKNSLRIGNFITSTADSFEKAMEILSIKKRPPYNLVLLDLLLIEPSSIRRKPRKYESKSIDLFKGLVILDSIQENSSAEAVIVVSGFPEYMLDAFRKGATDFIGKPFHAEDLQERVLICWTRLLSKKSKTILAQRINELIPYAEKGMAHRFTSSFSNLVRAVAHSAEDIERYARERYGLSRNRNGDDFLFSCLDSQEKSIAQVKREWNDLISHLQAPSDSSWATPVSKLLREINEELLPCFAVKNVVLHLTDNRSREVLTFENDVKAVLKEIIVGTVSSLKDFGAKKQSLKIKTTNIDGQVKVTFEDRLGSIRAVDLINQGAIIAPLPDNFDRAWGLSVVQHIAKRGGGRIEVEPRRGGGNIVNYFIPSAQ